MDPKCKYAADGLGFDQLRMSGKKRRKLSLGYPVTFSWQMIVPLDVVKSRLQADDFDKPKYRSAWHCACESYREDGFRVFFRGSLVLAIRAFPLNAVLFLVYSHSLRFLNRF